MEKSVSEGKMPQKNRFFQVERRQFLKLAWPAGFLLACPGLAYNIFKTIAADRKLRDLQRAEKIMRELDHEEFKLGLKFA